MGKTWTGDNLLRQVVYEGLREDKPAAEVRREVPHAKPGTQSRTLTAKKRTARRRPAAGHQVEIAVEATSRVLFHPNGTAAERSRGGG
jgi:bifunctional non-homologous end joining protein LigD